MSEPTQSKTCRRCGVTKPLDAFARNASCSDGRRGTCKECSRIREFVEVASKPCSSCGEVKAASEFGKNSRCRDGLTSACSACRAAAKRASYQRHRDSILAAQRLSYKNNPERAKAYAKGWKAANPDKVRQYRRLNYERNVEKVAAQAQEWREANPEKWQENLRTQNRKRRARKAGATVGPIDLDALWTGFCALCDHAIDKSLVWPHPLSKSVDHIVPLSKGGAHEQSNLQWTHLVCNNRKGASAP